MSSGFEIHQKRLLATWWDRNRLVWESVLKLPLTVWVTSRESWGALAWMDQPWQSIILYCLALWFPHLSGLKGESISLNPNLTPFCGHEVPLSGGLVRSRGVPLCLWEIGGQDKQEGGGGLGPPAGPCLLSLWGSGLSPEILDQTKWLTAINRLKPDQPWEGSKGRLEANAPYK